MRNIKFQSKIHEVEDDKVDEPFLVCALCKLNAPNIDDDVPEGKFQL